MERCPQPLRGCKYPEPFADDHHKVWPASEYNTPLEKKYRNLECNIVRGICRCLHDLEHLKRPPTKPTVEHMRRVIAQSSAVAAAVLLLAGCGKPETPILAGHCYSDLYAESPQEISCDELALPIIEGGRDVEG